ncbi:MAG: sporulation transcription factor Spo0A [Clostridia bacterium]
MIRRRPLRIAGTGKEDSEGAGRKHIMEIYGMNRELLGGIELQVATKSQPIGVMMADDNEALCKIVTRYLNTQPDLRMLGYFNDGGSLLTALEEEHPEVIILDVVMPHLDGISVLERLADSRHGDGSKVLMLSAFGQERITARACRLGAEYFLMKPFDLEILATRIRDMVNGGSEGLTGGASSEFDAAATDILGEVTGVLRAVGIPPNVRGYRYLRRAIMLVVSDVSLIEAVTKELYPAVAEEFDTTAARVERAIRHAIETAYDRAYPDLMERHFGYPLNPSRGKPTNSEFIALVADRVRLNSGRKEER